MDLDATTHPLDAPLPTALGPYLVEGVLPGAREVSWMTRHRWTGRRARLRVLPTDAARDPTALARFTLRARAASALGHPGVADLVDMGSADDGTVFMAWELIDGQPLDAFLAHAGPLSVEGAQRLLGPVIDALSECHARGLTHGALDAGAVMVETRDGAPRARLVDLGPGVDVPPSDDVRAVGALLHRCTAGPLRDELDDGPIPAWRRVPFHRSSPEAPPAFGEATRRRVDRTASMGALRAALRGTPPPFEVTRLDTPLPRRRPPRRGGVVIGVALGLGLALVGSLGLGAVVARALGAGIEPAPRVVGQVAREAGGAR